MKTVWVWGCLFGLVQGVWADSSAPVQKLHQPYFLQAKDKIPRNDLACPDVNLQGPDGKPLDLQVNIQPSGSKTMDLFSAPGIFEAIQRQRPSETTPQRFYWHELDEMEFCHFEDLEGNHWYGWKDDVEGKFNWVLWRGHRYWWHDAFAGHWLYYYQGVWWRADGQSKNSIQANLNGEYYACDAQGRILGDMGAEGDGDIVSAPGRYQGDSAKGGGHGGHGAHAGHSGGGQGGHNGGQSSQGSSSSGSPSSGTGASSSAPSAGN